LFQSKIISHDGRYKWIPRTADDKEFFILEEKIRKFDDEAYRIVETECLSPQLALLRVIFLTADEGIKSKHEIITIHSHEVLDGRAYIEFIYELISEICTETVSKEITLAPIPIPEARLTLDEQPPPAVRKCAWYTTIFLKAEELRKKSRENNTTIQGAIVASLILAVAPIVSANLKTYITNTPIDVRPFLGSEYKGGLSNLINVTPISVVADPTYAFWDLVRQG